MTPAWVEAMRLRTLPVSVAGVIAGTAYAIKSGGFDAVPAMLCLTFAILAQISSNFANEYFDYKAGFDTNKRRGPRRGVSCGEIKPEAMLKATICTLAAACVIGCSLIWYGGWWLLPVGTVIALGALAYSAGPYPLSRHCLGEVAVILFFGVLPVNLTYYVQTLTFSHDVSAASVTFGLLGSMVLMCNNYRDIDEDKTTGKHTLATVIGRRGMALLYLVSGSVAAALIWNHYPASILILVLTIFGFTTLMRHALSGQACTRLLAMTSMTMLAASLLLLVS